MDNSGKDDRRDKHGNGDHGNGGHEHEQGHERAHGHGHEHGHEHGHGGHEHGHGSHGEGGNHDDLVEVTVDRAPKRVKPGNYVVSAFKALVGVAADRELDILRDGQLVPLDDAGHIVIRGKEVFVSHARTGGSA